jgi:hypothetical protein
MLLGVLANCECYITSVVMTLGADDGRQQVRIPESVSVAIG